MPDNHTDTKTWAPLIAKIAFLVLTVALVSAVIYLLRNVMHAIIIGCLLAIILMPLNKWMNVRVENIVKTWNKKHGRSEFTDQQASRCKMASSFIMVCLVFFMIVIPLSLFVDSVARQGIDAIPKAAYWIRNDMSAKAEAFYSRNKKRLHLETGLNALNYVLKNYASDEIATTPQQATNTKAQTPSQDDIQSTEDIDTHIPIDNSQAKATAALSKVIGKFALICLGKIRTSILSMLAKAGVIIFNFFIMLFVMFHIFLDGQNIWNYLVSISPLSHEAQSRIVIRIKNVSRAIFYSIFGTAIIQGLLAMIAFWIVGIPALFWGALLGLCSVIPFVGTGLVWVPVTIFLFLTEQFWQAIFILVFCGGLVANVDSIIRPLLMKHGGKTGMSYMVLFFSIMGGLQTFGLIGIIYGPIIVGLCGICLLIFSTHFKDNPSLETENQNNEH